MLARQAEEGQRAVDGLLHPGRQAGIAARSLGQPCGEIGIGLGEIAPVLEPAQLLQAVVAILSRQVIERIPEEMHVGAVKKPASVDSRKQSLIRRGLRC